MSFEYPSFPWYCFNSSSSLLSINSSGRSFFWISNHSPKLHEPLLNRCFIESGMSFNLLNQVSWSKTSAAPSPDIWSGDNFNKSSLVISESIVDSAFNYRRSSNSLVGSSLSIQYCSLNPSVRRIMSHGKDHSIWDS